MPAKGYDLSPSAVLAARTKVANYQTSRIKAAWKKLKRTLDPKKWNGASRDYPEPVELALPGKLLWHAYRRSWVTARKHLPDADVAGAGCWRGVAVLKASYQRPDNAAILAVV